MRYKSTTGLDHDQIQELVTRIHQVIHPARTPMSRPGRPPALGLYRQVVLTLVLLRQNLPQTVVADWFEVSQPTVSRIYRRTLPLIEQVTCLHRPPLPDVLKGRVVLVDGTLVPIGNRETDRATHQTNFSGKHHAAGLSVQVVSTLDGLLLTVSDPVPGSTHDRAAFRATGCEQLLVDNHVLADLAYQGTHAIRPVRKPPRPNRTAPRPEHPPHNKTWNSSVASLRAAVERTIAHWKNWKILATGHRGRLTELPNLIRIITTLEHYRNDW